MLKNTEFYGRFLLYDGEAKNLVLTDSPISHAFYGKYYDPKTATPEEKKYYKNESKSANNPNVLIFKCAFNTFLVCNCLFNFKYIINIY